MTEQDLRDLDAELDNGSIDEEQYCATLRDEVARVHPDYDQCTIENMIHMQLRIEALESVLVEDVTVSDLPDSGGVIEAASSGKEGGNKSSLKEDDKDSQIKALLQKLKEKAEKQLAEQKEGSQQPLNGTQSDVIQNDSLNGQMQDQNSEHDDQRQNDQNKQNGKDDQLQQDTSKQDQNHQNQDQQNQQNDNSKGDKSNQKPKVWWTWQIVPDWNEWMKDD